MINFILNTKSKYVIMYANNIGGKAMKKIICKREYDTDTSEPTEKNTPRVSSEKQRALKNPFIKPKKGFSFFM